MSIASDQDKRHQIIDACREMNRLGINQGTSGNISLRHDDGMLITPTSVPYNAMQVDQIVFMKLDSEPGGGQRPSSEWRFHRDILKARPEVNAVVHAHPPFATVLAIMGREIPAVHYMIACAGGDTIRCAPYATFGTEELSRHAVTALADRSACLLAHHGMIVVGTSLAKAMWLAVEVETLARQYHGCLQIGTPPLLSKAEIENVRTRMAGYGVGEE
ncbi:class II aldolase/adducin family protein [Bradyrhizobium erythrophlei]|uniref:L-fuculose-phosphate aldolase n=1 Tax=Bradyrhizobium erythrophlei TaxID=1437360 RepID=A0A1M7UH93_9BRAD|nr:class II aldolase/adducin family protein [Bradyrhizobium erythrophlei]SHN82280.1 L-fuculose-phosphate aldolase [Bradyrhizobium erythrophlei]